MTTPASERPAVLERVDRIAEWDTTTTDDLGLIGVPRDDFLFLLAAVRGAYPLLENSKVYDDNPAIVRWLAAEFDRE